MHAWDGGECSRSRAQQVLHGGKRSADSARIPAWRPGWTSRPGQVVALNFTLCATPEQAAAYVGLVPVPRQSGTSVRGRPAIGCRGNGRLRTALYMATRSTAQRNPVIKPFYDRLRAAGKPMKVARCAAARKLLHLAWAVGTTQRPFDPRYQQQHAPSTALAT